MLEEVLRRTTSTITSTPTILDANPSAGDHDGVESAMQRTYGGDFSAFSADLHSWMNDPQVTSVRLVSIMREMGVFELLSSSSDTPVAPDDLAEAE